jgi:hypothetical protein
MSLASEEFANKYLNKFWIESSTAVFTREEIDVLNRTGHITGDTAQLLLELCYDPVRDLHDYACIFHNRHESIPYNGEQLMGLKRLAATLMTRDEPNGLRQNKWMKG